MTAPQPPGDLARRDPLFVELPAGTLLHRFYTAAHAPIFFDRGRNGRFNAPDGSTRLFNVPVIGSSKSRFFKTSARSLIQIPQRAGPQPSHDVN